MPGLPAIEATGVAWPEGRLAAGGRSEFILEHRQDLLQLVAFLITATLEAFQIFAILSSEAVNTDPPVLRKHCRDHESNVSAERLDALARGAIPDPRSAVK